MTGRDCAKGPSEGRVYYAQRSGLDAPNLTFEKARTLIAATYDGLERAGWFQEWFGYECVDAGDVSGKAGPDRDGFLHTRLWIPGLWPLRTSLQAADERTLFSVIELLFDCISAPVDGTFHNWSNCGWHYRTFDGQKGQDRWRDDVNRVLQYCGDGYELSVRGDVENLGTPGVRELMQQPIPHGAPRADRDKVEAAVRAYRHFSASRQQRLDAIRNLADVLEYNRQQIKAGELSADEGDLFNIANNFAIRHHHKNQKSDYSPAFVDWLFYMFLSSIHLTLQLMHGQVAAPETIVHAQAAKSTECTDSDYGDDIPF